MIQPRNAVVRKSIWGRCYAAAQQRPETPLFLGCASTMGESFWWNKHCISFQCCKTPNSHRQTITHHIKLIGRLCSHVHSKLNGSFLCWNLTRFQKSDQNIVSAHRGIFEFMIWLEVVARKRSQISKLKKKASYYYHCACIDRDEINSISRKQLKRTCSVSSCLDPHVDHGQQIIYYEEKYIFSCGKKVDHPERTKKGSFCSQSEHTIRFLQGHPTRI